MRSPRLLWIAALMMVITACGGNTEVVDENALMDKQLDQILAAKVPYATSKTEAPVLNTHEWDLVFGGVDGKQLKYDQYGEVDELVFVAPPGMVFTLQRQIRKKTRLGDETIYYKVATEQYDGTQPLWIDGRFLDVMDVKPAAESSKVSPVKTLATLRSFDGLPYTWHGSSATGAQELLLYYPPTERLSERSQSDWTLKGFNSLGLLYRASNGETPLDSTSIARFGTAVSTDLAALEIPEGKLAVDVQAQALMDLVQPLDVIQFGDRVIVVLDRNQVIEARYESKYAGKVVISNLADTVYGLLSKGVFVSDPFADVPLAGKKKFFIRRYADTSSLSTLLSGEGEEDPSSPADQEALKTDEEPESSTESPQTGDANEPGATP